MKNPTALLFATLLTATATLSLIAAEPASAFGLAPSRPDSLLPEGQGGLSLIPDAMPPLDDSSKGKKEKKSTTSEAEDALRDQIKLRVAKNKAKNDPELLAIWDSTFKARTDYEQREIYAKYYTLLCERIAKIDKTIKKQDIEVLKDYYLSRFDQKRIAPTVPPEPARTR